MALYRTISMAFWTDSKIVDDFTPEDKYFYLYLFTNPHTNLCGCYEISIKQIVNEIGYSDDSVRTLIRRFEEIHKVIRYCKETKEILLLNWHKYNWSKSDKFLTALRREIEGIKCEVFKKYYMSLVDGDDTVSIRYPYCIDTSVTNTITVTNANTDTITESREPIVNRRTDKSIQLQEQIEDNFEMLWSIYPRKKGKNSVSKKAKKEAYRIGYDHMARAIERYAKETEKTDQQYIMYGSSFFNTGYVDYLDENYEPPKNSTEDAILRFLQRGD